MKKKSRVLAVALLITFIGCDYNSFYNKNDTGTTTFSCLLPLSPQIKRLENAISVSALSGEQNSGDSLLLPPSTIPFDPLPAPRADLHPVGAKPDSEQSEAERYLHTLLDMIVAGNSSMFTGMLKPDNFRFEYISEMTRTATVDLTQLVVKVSPRFFTRIRSDAQAAAILSHEVSHVLLGHPDFNMVPDLASKDPRYQEQLAAVEAVRKDLHPETMAAIFEQYKKAEQELKKRYEKVRPGALQPLQSAWQKSSGKEAQQLRDEIRKLLDSFANEDSSSQAQAYQDASYAEHDCIARLDRFKQQNTKLNDVVDEILMDPGAASNWKEQEADEPCRRVDPRRAPECREHQ